MADYQRIEYRIDRHGRIIETVLDAVGTQCVEATAGIEQALGRVVSQEFLPSYYTEEESDPTMISPTVNQVGNAAGE